MYWQKIGFYHIPKNSFKWSLSHAQLPTALPISNEVVRIFFATRSAKQISSISYVEIKFNDPSSFEVIKLADSPVIQPGKIGTFDEHGVFPSSIEIYDSVYYMYYIGWNRGYEAPLFYASIGLATSSDGVIFTKNSPAPLISRNSNDPILVTSPNVIKISRNNWIMFYTSGLSWNRTSQNNLQSNYHIKIAKSKDLIDWKREGHVAINLTDKETNIARPSTLKLKNNSYGMWYSYVNSRVGKYRIGFAESDDCENWNRKDDISGIDIDANFCKEMICYPHVFKLNDQIYMLYNGDNYGEKGFGVARLQIKSI